MSGDADTVLEARRLLDELAAVWQGRLDRIGEILADPDPPPAVRPAGSVHPEESTP